MPVDINAYHIVSLNRSIILARLPIPKPHLSLSIAGCQKLSIGAEFDSACEPLIDMALKYLFPILLEVTFAVIDKHFVVH